MALQLVSRVLPRLAGISVVALALTSGLTAAVLAQSTTLPQSQTVGVQTFLANPIALLNQNPKGGPTLISQIRDLAVADPSTLDRILGLLSNANKDQKTAIASGLAQAAKIVVKTNAPYATRIQLAIADTKDQDVVLAYSAAAGEAPIGAAGGGGGGGGGGASGGASGGQTNSLPSAPTGTGTAQAINGSSTPTGQFSYTSSVSGNGTTNGTSTTLTTLSVSVSP
jgi:hypothetical protein